ncbi:unnamed protein product [Tenebrio molitor]|nr:unnamed protein product [Tenebrio molitor]
MFINLEKRSIKFFAKKLCINISHVFNFYNLKIKHKPTEECTVPSKKKTGRQNHTLMQRKMLHCRTVVNIITYHHVV